MSDLTVSAFYRLGKQHGADEERLTVCVELASEAERLLAVPVANDAEKAANIARANVLLEAAALVRKGVIAREERDDEQRSCWGMSDERR